MGIVNGKEILARAKQAQGETDTRLDALPAGQKRTNELFATLIPHRAGQG